MKRKRKAEEEHDPSERNNKEPIDLTLSDEDEHDRTQPIPAGHTVIPATVLSSDDENDNDEIQFVKEKDLKEPCSSAKKNAGPSSVSNAKTINDVLKDKNKPLSTPKSLPPLLLSTPASVASHTPCSLHYDILPPNLAERLYKRMMEESKSWKRNKWYLNDRMVESTHKTCFYTSSIKSSVECSAGDGVVDDKQWYMGRQLTEGEEQKAFPDEMEEARIIIEEFVNEELKKKMLNGQRYALEYDGNWKANVAASNCYRGGSETVGYHADQLTYLGPYPTIASISLGTTRIFRLRGVHSSQDSTNTNNNNYNNHTSPIRTYDIELPHNSLCIMGAGTQEKYKHTIPPARSIDVFKVRNEDGTVETYIERINITFRFYRPDFRASTTPLCKCGIPSVLKADAKGKVAASYSSHNAHYHTNGQASNEDMEMDKTMRFFWMCFAGAQNEGKRCNFFKVLDMKGEKRGPCIGDSNDFHQ